jgi:hypothetical protein
MNAANDSQGHDRAATTEASEKSSGTPFAAATPSAHPPYDSRPMELAIRMATASAGLRGRRPLENAALFVVLLVLPLSQRPCARWGCPHPRSDAVSVCDGAGAYRNSASTPDAAKQGRIDATCGAAGSCTESATGCAQAPRRCRVVSAAGDMLRAVSRMSSVATAACRPLGIRSCAAVSATSIDHVSSAQRVVVEDSVPPDEIRCLVPS